jgi:hypothetical protein
MSREESEGKYEVGYARPPRNTQFQKGRSGNPTGRPKKPAGFDQQLLREANLPVVVNENGKQVRLTKMNVAMRHWVHKAMKGDAHATKSFLSYYQQASDKAVLLTEQREAKRNRTSAGEFSKEELTKIIRDGLGEEARDKKL